MADTDKLVKVGQLDTIVDEIVDKFGETNGRLGDLNLLETETKTDLVSAINEAAQSSAPSAVTCTVDENGDATFALGEEDLSDIAALVGGTA